MWVRYVWLMQDLPSFPHIISTALTIWLPYSEQLAVDYRCYNESQNEESELFGMPKAPHEHTEPSRST